MQQTLAPSLPPVFPKKTSSRNPVLTPASSAPRKLPDPLSTRPVWELARLAGSLVEISGTADSGILSSALALVAEAQHNQLRRHRTHHGLTRDRWTQARQIRQGPPGPNQAPSNHALVAWIATTRSLFFPPDAVESGIALDRLILLRLETPAAQIRAATRIVHSGAFGLVVVDLADSAQPEPPGGNPGRNSGPDSAASSPRRRNVSPGVPPLSQLAGLARKYRTAVVLLTDKPPAAPSLDPRVGKRFDASRRGNGPGGNRIVITVLKDKVAGRSSSPRENRELPPAPGSNCLPPGFRFERECREPAGMC